MDNLVKYNNDLNKVVFGSFSSVDADIFFSLCSLFANTDGENITLSYSDIVKIAHIDRHVTTADISALIGHMAHNLLKLNFEAVIAPGEKIYSTFFTDFHTYDNEQKLAVSISKWALPVVKALQDNFTMFELQQFVSLNSKYSKTLFRLLKQYRTTGVYNIDIDDLKTILCVPEKYDNKTFVQFILNPAVAELKKQCFVRLKYSTIRDSSRRGRPLKGFHFTFKKETTKKKVETAADTKQKDSFNYENQRTYNNEDLENMLL